MAFPTSISGNDVNIFVRTATGPDVYKGLVCGTDASLTTSKDPIESTTKCGRSIKPGIFKWEMNFSGEVDTSPDTTEHSLADIWASYQAGTIGTWALQKADLSWGFLGTGYITKCDVSAPVDGIVTFTVTITGEGELDILT